MCGLREGLKLFGEKGFTQVEVESESMMAIKLITQGCAQTHSCFNVIHEIKMIAGRFQDIRFSHILREANQSVDSLAGHGLICMTVGDRFF